MQRYSHYGASYSSPSPAAPVEEIHAEQEEVYTEEEVNEEEEEEEEEPLIEEEMQPVVQETGRTAR